MLCIFIFLHTIDYFKMFFYYLQCLNTFYKFLNIIKEQHMILLLWILLGYISYIYYSILNKIYQHLLNYSICGTNQNGSCTNWLVIICAKQILSQWLIDLTIPYPNVRNELWYGFIWYNYIKIVGECQFLNFWILS